MHLCLNVFRQEVTSGAELIQVRSFLIAENILNTVWTTVGVLENNKAC